MFFTHSPFHWSFRTHFHLKTFTNFHSFLFTSIITNYPCHNWLCPFEDVREQWRENVWWRNSERGNLKKDKFSSILTVKADSRIRLRKLSRWKLLCVSILYEWKCLEQGRERGKNSVPLLEYTIHHSLVNCFGNKMKSELLLCIHGMMEKKREREERMNIEFADNSLPFRLFPSPTNPSL